MLKVIFVLIKCIFLKTGHMLNSARIFVAEWGGFGGHRSVFGKPPIPKGRTSLVSNNGTLH